MVEEQITTSDTAPADTSPDDGADIGQTMEAVYDSHHGSDQDSDASEYVSNETETLPTENFAPEQPVETPTSLQMPQAWGKSQEAIWNGLTPDAQRYVAQRELEAQRRISELGHLAKHGDVGQTFESYKAQGLVPHGEDGQPLSAPQLIESALAFDHQLRRSPAEAITALANAHGVDLAGLAGVQSNTEYSPEIMQVATQLTEALQRDPAAAIAALARQYGVPDHSSAYEQAQAELAQQHALRQQQEYAAREQWLQSEIDQFANGKPYWSSIEDEVIAQVSLLRSMNPTKARPDTKTLSEGSQFSQEISVKRAWLF